MRIRELSIAVVIWTLSLCAGCTVFGLLYGKIDLNKTVYIKDQYNRIVQYHGVNHSNASKYTANNLPWHDGSAYNKLNLEWGFNLVRFQIFWSAVEPKKDSIDFIYLRGVEKHLAALEELGIDVILDWHQDLYAQQFTGNGMPNWTVHTDGFPFNQQQPWHMNYKEPAVIASFTHFWKNADDIQTQCVDAIGLVMKRFENHKNIIGIDPFNEPFPGAYVVTFEQQELTNYYIKIQSKLSEMGRGVRLCFEPCIFATTIPTMLAYEPLASSVYYPHYYDAMIDYGASRKYERLNWRIMKEIIEVRVIEAQRFGTPFMIGEFGMKQGVSGRQKFYDDMMYLSDIYQFGWTVWSYDPINYNDMGLIDSAGNEQEIMQKLVRTYPQRIAGRKPKWSTQKNVFQLTYEPDLTINEPTVVFIPPRLKNIYVTANQDGPMKFEGGLYQHQNVGSEKQKIVVTWDLSDG